MDRQGNVKTEGEFITRYCQILSSSSTSASITVSSSSSGYSSPPSTPSSKSPSPYPFGLSSSSSSYNSSSSSSSSKSSLIFPSTAESVVFSVGYQIFNPHKLLPTQTKRPSILISVNSCAM